MNPALSQLIRDTDKLVGSYEARVTRQEQLAVEVHERKGAVSLLELTDTALTALLAQTSAENLKAIEDLVTSGLAAIFDDCQLSFKFQVEQARGQQALVPVLVSNGLEAPILDAHGGGPASVVAVLLRILTVHRLGLHPLIVLDEALSMVSTSYVGNTARFLVGLCERLGLTVVLVTHQEGFVAEATRAYQIVTDASGATAFELLEK